MLSYKKKYLALAEAHAALNAKHETLRESACTLASTSTALADRYDALLIEHDNWRRRALDAESSITLVLNSPEVN